MVDGLRAAQGRGGEGLEAGKEGRCGRGVRCDGARLLLLLLGQGVL